MSSILEYNYWKELNTFYKDIKRNVDFDSFLSENNIYVIDDFLKNKINIKNFYSSFVNNDSYKIFLIGINPGLHGAGQTGIPFMDFDTLRKALSKIDIQIENEGFEPSANFFQSVVNKIGFRLFYQNFYVTNISPIGFYKISDNHRKVNFNYYNISQKFNNILFNNLINEIKYFKPDVLIPLSIEVEYTLKEIKKEYKLNFNIGERIRHPNYCSKRKKHLDNERNHYYEILYKYC